MSILESILAKVRQSDLDQFVDKIRPQEEAFEQSLKDRGLKNIEMIIEDSKKNVYLDYEIQIGQSPESESVEEKQEGMTGEEMMTKFLEKLK